MSDLLGMLARQAFGAPEAAAVVPRPIPRYAPAPLRPGEAAPEDVAPASEVPAELDLRREAASPPVRTPRAPRPAPVPPPAPWDADPPPFGPRTRSGPADTAPAAVGRVVTRSSEVRPPADDVAAVHMAPTETRPRPPAMPTPPLVRPASAPAPTLVEAVVPRSSPTVASPDGPVEEAVLRDRPALDTTVEPEPRVRMSRRDEPATEESSATRRNAEPVLPRRAELSDRPEVRRAQSDPGGAPSSPAAAGPTVEVTIGRIEIRASVASADTKPRRKGAEPAMVSLDEFLRDAPPGGVR
jgi:hypothetical protein